MAEPFLSEIRIMSFVFAPKGWAFCNGQLLPINQNQPLFSLLGTMYGGDGRVNFALPDFRGKVPVHVGADFTQGQRGGETAHTVTINEMPQHFHVAQGYSQNGDGIVPTDGVLSVVTGLYAGSGSANLVALNPASISNVGGSQAHNNMQPYLVLNFIIALQ